MRTVVADGLSSRIAPYQDRRTQRTAYRVEAVIKTDGPALRLTTFAKSKHVADWQVERLVPGAKGVFTGKVNKFNNNWQLAHPQMIMLTDEPGDARTESALAMAEGLKSLFPIYSRSEAHTSELQSLMRISYAVFCLQKKKKHN